MEPLLRTCLLGLTLWIGVAAAASVHTRREVRLLLEERARQAGVLRGPIETPVDGVEIVWAFSPLPPFHVARVEVTGSTCWFSKGYFFLSWAHQRRVLWEGGG